MRFFCSVLMLIIFLTSPLLQAGEEKTDALRMRPATAVLLRAVLADKTDLDRARAAMALGRARVHDAKTLAKLKAALQDSDPLLRASAAYALGRSGEPASAAALLIALTDKDAAVRSEACRALGALRAKQSVAALPVADNAVVVRMAALAALGKIATPQAITILEKRFAAEKKTALKALVLRCLRRAKAKISPSMQHALRDPEVEVRREFLRWLAVAGEANSLPESTFAPLLKDDSALIRRAAISAVARVCPATTAALILPLLTDADHTVRRTAALTLGKVGDTQTHAGLVLLFEDSSRLVRRAAAQALVEQVARGACPKEAVVALAKKTLDDPNPRTRLEGVYLLGALKSAAGFPKIMDWVIRKKVTTKDVVFKKKLAISSLVMWTAGQAKYQPAAALAALYLDLPDGSPLRLHGARVLGILQAREAIPLLIKKLMSVLTEQGMRSFRYIGLERRAAIEALGAMPSEAGLMALAKILAAKDPQDEYENLRVISQILAREKFTAALPRLRKALASKMLAKTQTALLLADVIEKLTGHRPKVLYRETANYDNFFLNAVE